ncbi:glycosyltransferase family 2 protein [Capnocytophaga cynodegmi]|nr:glycosyltransferase family 2 protein [Capnocytophaga cynodegmi]GIM54971.1 sugar transferase [Capnocytophaga cynodegmi]
MENVSFYRKKTITIFTATFNRSKYLSKLYDSLCRQTFPSDYFEWLIVDDGSSDETEVLVNSWIKENKICIYYQQQKHGGKHRAVNKGLDLAKGELFFIVDSDDFLPEKSLEIAMKYYLSVKEDSDIIGVVGLMATPQGNIIGGKTFPNILESNLIERKNKYGITADMAKVIKTEKFREFYFPDIPGENFVAESIVWNRMAVKYKFRYFNEIIYIAEYLEGGLSNNSIRNRRKNPIYATTLYKELVKNPHSNFKTKMKSAINYWRFALCNKKIIIKDTPLFITPVYLFTLPIGLLFNIKDSIYNNIDVKKLNK